MKNDENIKKIVNELQNKYMCHTIILYGSYARGNANENSDYDIIAIRESGPTARDCQLIDNTYLDAFIYSEDEISKLNASFIRIKDGIVICQKNTLGDDILTKVKEIYNLGPPKLPDFEKKLIITWSNKMLNRAKLQDIEGNFRRHWLLYDLLEAYFQLRDAWYLGPKESFQWLNKHDKKTYQLFDEALKMNAKLSSLEKLIQAVTCKMSDALC